MKSSMDLPRDIFFWAMIKGAGGSLSVSEADAGRSIFLMTETALHRSMPLWLCVLISKLGSSCHLFHLSIQ